MTGAIVLAAGASSRLGRPKQLVELDGETLVHRVARMALEAGCGPVVVVEGAVPLAEVLADLPVEVVPCAEWAAGQGASLRCGVEALWSRVEAVVVLLVDQLRVTSADVRALVEAPGDVVAAAYAGGVGVPARFSGASLAVLRMLPVERGARTWLAENRAQVTALAMPHAEVDLDHPGDLPRAR